MLNFDSYFCTRDKKIVYSLTTGQILVQFYVLIILVGSVSGAKLCVFNLHFHR